MMELLSGFDSVQQYHTQRLATMVTIDRCYPVGYLVVILDSVHR